MTGLILILSLLAIGYASGRFLERRHYASIRSRERALVGLPAATFEDVSDGRPIASAELVVGNVVVSVDYYKRLLTGIRKLFGGELGSYASLIDRGRREAILRMKESRPDADVILNCRLETSSISKGQGERIGSVEVLAYGTAVKYAVDEVRPEDPGAAG